MVFSSSTSSFAAANPTDSSQGMQKTPTARKSGRIPSSAPRRRTVAVRCGSGSDEAGVISDRWEPWRWTRLKWPLDLEGIRNRCGYRTARKLSSQAWLPRASLRRDSMWTCKCGTRWLKTQPTKIYKLRVAILTTHAAWHACLQANVRDLQATISWWMMTAVRAS